MISFADVQTHQPVNRDYILDNISAEMIFAYYLPQFRKTGKKFLSPLHKERTPSAEIRYNKNGKLVFNDFGGLTGLDCFDLVKELHRTDFSGALKIVASDFGLDNGAAPVHHERIQWVRNLEKQIRSETLVQFELLDWPQSYLDYWDNYYITKAELAQDKDVFAIGELCVNKKWFYHRPGDPQFVYVVRDPDDYGKVYFKIYRPNSECKWIANFHTGIPFGFYTMPGISRTVIITKSYKDMKVLRKFHPDTCATQNEDVYAARNLLERLKTTGRYDHYVLWYDADRTGIEKAEALSGDFTLTVTTPLQLTPHIKDPADLIQSNGLAATRQLVTHNLEQIKDLCALPF